MQADPVAEDLYVVESIIGKKVVDGKPYYRVKWEGYPETDSTWEKPAHLRYVAAMVKDYERTLSLSTEHPDTSEEHPALPTPSSDATDPDPPAFTSIIVPQEQSSNGEQEQPIIPRELPQEGEGKQTQEKEKEELRPTRSALKDKKRKKKPEDCNDGPTKPQPYLREQKKEAKRLKQLRKEEVRTHSPIIVQQEEEKNDNQGAVIVKREEAEVRIRLIVSQDDSDIRDYVVQYPTGTTRVLDTCQLFYTHPVEFVGYLEKRTALRRNK